MGLFSKDIRSMDDLYLHALQDIYHAVNQILKALPRMIEKAGLSALREDFETHLAETREQVARLERAFESLGETPQGTNCPAIDGIIEKASEIAGVVDDQDVPDAALAAAAQAVEHNEITR
jgi:ferritin-like metal-binding protein YciE